MSNHLTTF